MEALVIDDSRAVRMLIGKILRDLGFHVSEAGNGREGLEKLRGNPEIRLVLVDWNMPIMDGLEATRNIVKIIKDYSQSAAYNESRI